MAFQITYTNRWTGQKTVHEYSGSEAGARGWAETLSRENNGCRAEAVHVSEGRWWNDGPRGTITHLITVGNDPAPEPPKPDHRPYYRR